jgi:hypothetical protein
MLIVPFTATAGDPSHIYNISEESEEDSIPFAIPASINLNTLGLSQEEITQFKDSSIKLKNDLVQIEDEYGVNLVIDEVSVIVGRQVILMPILADTIPMVAGDFCSFLLALIIWYAVVALALGVASIPLGDIMGWIAFFAALNFGLTAAMAAIQYKNNCMGSNPNIKTAN